MIELENASVTVEPSSYCGRRKHGKAVLSDVCLSIAQTDGLVVVMGPSGSGKSSLLRLMSLINRPSGWSVTGNASIRGDIALAECAGTLYPHQTVRETLEVRALLSMGAAQVAARVSEMLGLCGLDRLESRLVDNNLSNGERKRVEIAEGLLSSPSGIAIDEPLSGLDAKDAAAIQTILRTVADDGRLVIISVHRLPHLFVRRCDRVLTLAGGRVIKDELLRTPKDTETISWTQPKPLTQFGVLCKRHMASRWWMTNRVSVWLSRLGVIVILSVCFSDLAIKGDFFSVKGCLFFPLMHMNYETLYTSQGLQYIEGPILHSEVTSGLYYSGLHVFAKQLVELLFNSVEAFCILIPLFLASFKGGNGVGGVILTATPTMVLFCLTTAALWQMTGAITAIPRHQTFVGDAYVAIATLLSGFWVAVSDFRLPAVRFLSQQFLALELLLSGLPADLECELQGEPLDVEECARGQGFFEYSAWMDIMFLLILWLGFSGVTLLLYKWGPARKTGRRSIA